MSSVGLAMIVRNAADTLVHCLQSVKGVFDDVVVVDTGSDDASKDVANQFGARVFDFEWVYDFSAARNFSFDQLKTDWIFWLDADDVLIGKDTLSHMVEQCDEKGLDGILMEYLYSFTPNGIRLLEVILPDLLQGKATTESVRDALMPHCLTTQYRERLVRNSPDLRWVYPIHEAIAVGGRKFGRYDAMKVVHRRHMRKVQNEPRRNLDILDRVPEERRDSRIWFYYGLEYAHLGTLEIDKSIESFEKYLPLSTIEDEKYLALHWLACLYKVKDNYDKSVECDLRAVGMRPTWRDAYSGLLNTYVKLKQWNKAVYYGAMARKAEIPDTPFAHNPVDENSGWVNDYVQVLYELQQFPEAFSVLEDALKTSPDNATVAYNFDIISTVINNTRASQTIADSVEYFLRNDDAETAAMLIARMPREFLQNPNLNVLASMTNQACHDANNGIIPSDVLKPSYLEIYSTVEADIWRDRRIIALRDYISLRPDVKNIIVFGGLSEMDIVAQHWGVSITKCPTTNVQGTQKFDLAVLWNCLDRVKFPDVLVETAKGCVREGGYLWAMTPNGPATKGLAPPAAERVRLRYYTQDKFRIVLGTTNMPQVLPAASADSGELILDIPFPLPKQNPKRIAIGAPNSPERWGPWSLGRGIGGSEEAVIRLSRALVRRGHSVTVYGTGWEGADSQFGIEYTTFDRYKYADVFLGWRYPEIFTLNAKWIDAEFKALWLHDTIEYDRVKKAEDCVDLIWCISDYHAALYDGVSKVYRGRNGIDSFEFDQLELEGPIARNPYKMIYVSTPFRGLNILLHHWPEIKRRVPEAELHCYYGWETADLLGATKTKEGAEFKEKIMQQIQELGVIWHGRISQHALRKEMLSAGVLTYSCTHLEENCISSTLCQAAGAWPVVHAIGALDQTTVFGWKTDAGKFVDCVVDAANTHQGRETMMQWARKNVTWDYTASLWERLFQGKPA